MQGEDFEALLSRYEMVALIANSESVDIDVITSTLPEKTLYVFFTGCAKVLSRPFEKDAVLCHRLVAGGTRFLKSQKHFDKAYSLFKRHLKAEIGVIADRGVPEGSPGLAAPRKSTLMPQTLDFDHTFGPLYPVDRMPTTGFAIAVWLAEKIPHANICLCGFTGTAGLQFSMYTEHDWTFEQITLQLFVKKGRIRRFEEQLSEPAGSFARIHNRFPEFSEATIALVATNVLASRFTGMERQVAKLWSKTKLERRIRGFFKRFKNFGH
ncbi:hypothetical protein JNB71_24190 [Rhizobium herbae]|uniref:3-deoxy-manno-octulosonate cytidylyltransferase n=1 Tax=Rhizobium herbae TaxID=508661 RepID=A0ABS7HHQ7_9HYPH|nr:hypothetical protein [Rhizobium herbae]MBW9066409.1 hypothetical protein [Rhizobium herbae]